MKKWIVIVCLFIFAIISIFYFLMPTTQSFIFQTTVSCTENAVSRNITNKAKWQLWWPGEKINDTTYGFQNCTYRIDKILLIGIETTVFNRDDSLKGFLQFIYNGNNSTQFQFTSKHQFSANPLKRFVQYFQFKKIGTNVENLLTDAKKYFDNPENIYGLNIVKEKVTESSMVSAKNTFDHYPSTQEIYAMIVSVKEYVKIKGGDETSYPMLHVEKMGPMAYEVMVAIPTKTDVPPEGKFQLKNMRSGTMLMAEVKGGPYSVIKGDEELTNYLSDYKKNSPAIPFQSLVTNRLLETDTSKWVTKLYYPVFQY